MTITKAEMSAYLAHYRTFAPPDHDARSERIVRKVLRARLADLVAMIEDGQRESRRQYRRLERQAAAHRKRRRTPGSVKRGRCNA